MNVDPSLLAFTLARLDEDIDLVISNMPLFFDDQRLNPVFRDRFLDRGAVLNRLRTDRDVVLACVEQMRAVQGRPPVPVPDVPDGVTVLGSQVIKLIAERYGSHADYKEAWRPA